VAVLAATFLAWAGGEKSYISPRFGYGLSYPAKCGLKAAAEGAYIDLTFQGQRLPGASVQTVDATGKENSPASPHPWKEIMVARAKLSCAADGPNGTVYCQRVTRESAWQTTSGLKVLEL